MKTRIMLVSVMAWMTLTAFAQGPSIGIDVRSGTLSIQGYTNTYYQVSYSSDLVSWKPVWGPWGKKFFLTNSPSTQQIGLLNVPSLFFRAQAFLVSSTNGSYPDTCAEHDNVNLALFGNIPRFSIIATHPAYYAPTDYTCIANFNNCESGSDTNYSFSPTQLTLSYGTGYMVANREASFWRPHGMTLYIDGTWSLDDVHIIKVGKRIPGTGEWPQYFVLYSDGYARLIPFPPIGQLSVCFGSSVIIGPAEVSSRPFVDIESIDFRTSTDTALLTYRSGGTALIDFKTVTRTNALVKVAVSYPTDKPFCTFRSMYVSDGNSDCDQVIWRMLDGTSVTNGIMSIPNATGTEWSFSRQTPSIQRKSAPDITISLN